MTDNPIMDAREWSLLLLLSVLWGGSFFFAEVALDELPPFTVVLGRVGLAAMALIALAYASGARLPASPGLWGAFLAMGALNNLVPFCLIVWGQTQIDSGLAAVLNATTPLFSAVLAHFLTGEERLTPGRIVGILLGILGVGVLVGPAAFDGFGLRGLAQLAVLLAALSYAFAAIFGRRFKGLPPTVTAAGQVTASTLLVLPLALVLEQPWQLSAGATTWGAVVGLALLSTAAAYMIYFRILATAGATNLMLVTFLIPVSALLLGVLVLGERPGWPVYAGMAMIFLGLAAIDGRWLSRARRGAACRRASGA